MASSRFDGDWNALIDEVRMGPMVERAARHEIGLKAFVDAFVERVPSRDKSAITLLKRALLRQARAQGPGRDGYDHVVKELVESYAALWEGHVISGCMALCELEFHGFCYQTSQETMRVIRVLTEPFAPVFDAFDGDVVVHRYSVSGLFARLGLTFGPGGKLRCFNTLVCVLAAAAGWDCRKKNSMSVPIASVEAIELFMRNPPGSASDSGGSIATMVAALFTGNTLQNHFGGIVRAEQAGIPMAILRQAESQLPCALFDRLNDWSSRGHVDAELYERIVSANAVRVFGEDFGTYLQLLKAWKKIGFVIDLPTLRTIGGTEEAFRQHQQELEAKREREETEARQLAELQRLSHGAGGLDFDWAVAELPVMDLFPEMDSRAAGVILVHGLLRQGDRIRRSNALERVRDRKVWRQTKVLLDNDKKLYNETVAALLREGVLKRDGGFLQLAAPSSKQPNARDLVKRVKVLADRHGT